MAQPAHAQGGGLSTSGLAYNQYIGTPSAGNRGVNAEGKALREALVYITAAELNAIRATPKTLVAAPGAGRVLRFAGGIFFYDYVVAYTESTDNLAVKYTDGSGAAASETLETTGLLDATADTMRQMIPIKDTLMVANAALVLHNTGDGEYGGSGTSTIRVFVQYWDLPTLF